MKTQITLAASIAISMFAFASLAQAQSHGFTPMFSQVQPQAETVVMNGNGYGYHASTAAESRARGYADVIRAYGEADVNHARAAILWEAARAADIQNDYDYAQTFFAMREVNREARAAEAGPPVTSYEAEQFSASRMPDRLSREQYEPVVGQLYWPTALREAQFDDLRGQIERLMHARWSGESTSSEIHELATTLDTALTAEIREFTTQEYLSAKRFLASLRYEVTFPSNPRSNLASAE